MRMFERPEMLPPAATRVFDQETTFEIHQCAHIEYVRNTHPIHRLIMCIRMFAFARVRFERKKAGQLAGSLRSKTKLRTADEGHPNRPRVEAAGSRGRA
jgi:hypothetical protein